MDTEKVGVMEREAEKVRIMEQLGGLLAKLKSVRDGKDFDFSGSASIVFADAQHEIVKPFSCTIGGDLNICYAGEQPRGEHSFYIRENFSNGPFSDVISFRSDDNWHLVTDDRMIGRPYVASKVLYLGDGAEIRFLAR